MTDVAIWVVVGNKGLKIVILAHLQSYLGPPIPSFLRKHPHVAKRKISDTVIETEQNMLAEKSENKTQAMITLI